MQHLAFLLLAAGPALTAGAQIVWHIDDDAPAGGDGTSWATAFDDLQPAMELALPGDEIWVAEGVYVPSVIEPIAGEDQPYFLMPDGVAILGGFRGDETDAEQRDPQHFESIISGDLLGNDLDTPVTGKPVDVPEMELLRQSLEDNTGTLLFVDRTGVGTRLDGLVFESAYTQADVGARPSTRNGIFVIGAALEVFDCTFRNNHGNPGGALYTYACGPDFLDPDFAAMHPCGGAALPLLSAVIIQGCIFENNFSNFGDEPLAEVLDASLKMYDTICLVQSTEFRFDRIPWSGETGLGSTLSQSGLFIGGIGSGAVEQCMFTRCGSAFPGFTNGIAALGIGNTAIRDTRTSVEVNDCLFLYNDAARFGVARLFGGSARMDRNIFHGNRYRENGNVGGAAGSVIGVVGGVNPTPVSFYLYNSLFVGNRFEGQFADSDDLPVVVSFATVGRVYNNTFASNSTDAPMVSLSLTSLRDQIEENTLVLPDSFPDAWVFRPPSDGGDGWGDNPDTPATDESLNDDFGDLRLRPASPAIDAGIEEINSLLDVDLDFDGNDREVDDRGIPGNAVDLGAYEFQGASCLADVNQDGQLTPFDFSAWIIEFNSGAPRADQNRDGLVTPFDFNAWIINYNAGCP